MTLTYLSFHYARGYQSNIIKWRQSTKIDTYILDKHLSVGTVIIEELYVSLMAK